MQQSGTLDIWCPDTRVHLLQNTRRIRVRVPQSQRVSLREVVYKKQLFSLMEFRDEDSRIYSYVVLIVHVISTSSYKYEHLDHYTKLCSSATAVTAARPPTAARLPFAQLLRSAALGVHELGVALAASTSANASRSNSRSASSTTP